ncbi:uncharacterized protein LOC123318827 [Coccinella septempunctata]|uniref:uncharacterized protein LOC123318827 n=1 Tax=Coccinella septempunctata TaxID=41139 RepID=UPI001D072E16|nr:uncharacterized protein LOC123318827 [Coccinella septempunctata]
MNNFVLVLFVATALAEEVKPLYKYRYESEDVMKTAASTIPVHGYHVVEGGYYPYEADLGLSKYEPAYSRGGYSAGLGKFGGIGPGYQYGPYGGSIGYGPAIGLSPGYIGTPYQGGYGGGIVDKNIYRGGKKSITDENYEKVHGKKGEEISRGQEGYNHGQVALKNVKGDSGYYNEEEAGKKLFEDGKHYNGAQHFAQEGLNGGQKKINTGHKKGHSIKGFKTSHHKDESGKTEEYYDEENDEGNNVFFNGQHGSFGENAASSFKGGHADGKFNAGESKKEGHYDQEHYVGNSNAGKGSFGSKKYAGSGEVYGVNNGLDQHSLLGHQESERFFNHHPDHTPFYGSVYRK